MSNSQQQGDLFKDLDDVEDRVSRIERFISKSGSSSAAIPTRSVLDVGVLGQTRAGRNLAVADIAAAGLPSTPAGLWMPGSLNNLGNGGALVNKGGIPLNAKGILAAADAYLFAGSTGQVLYTDDIGGNDPFRIATGTWWGWFRVAKSANQVIISKMNSVAQQGVFNLQVPAATNTMRIGCAFTATAFGGAQGTDYQILDGTTSVVDDRWHFAAGVYDGSTMRLFVDGYFEDSIFFAGQMFGGSGPLNIGGLGGNAGTACSQPFFGRIYQPGVSPDVFSEDQLRFIMATSIPHQNATAPIEVALNITRKKRGPVLATTDLSVTPNRLYNLAASAGNGDANLGSDGSGANLTDAGGVSGNVAGPNGAAFGAYAYNGAASGISTATDTGLPVSTSTTLFAMFKCLANSAAGNQSIVNYGSIATRMDIRLNGGGPGLTFLRNGNNASVTIAVTDGTWHFIVFVYDPAAADLLTHKAYLDGKLIAGWTGTATITPAGAAGFRIGATGNANEWFTGDIARVGLGSYVMGEDEILNIYDKGSQAQLPSPYPANELIEGRDATNLYVLTPPEIDSQHALDFAVIA